jgi:hypothetical protein
LKGVREAVTVRTVGTIATCPPHKEGRDVLKMTRAELHELAWPGSMTGIAA